MTTPTHPAGEPEVIADIRAACALGAALPIRLEQYANILTAYDQCAREREEAVADAMGVINVLGFFASCIKSGEPWTPECDAMLKQAFAHRATPTGRGEEA